MAASVPMMNRPTNTMSSTPAAQQQKLAMTVFHWRISFFVFIVVPTPTTSRLALTLPRGAMPAVVTISVGRPHRDLPCLSSARERVTPPPRLLCLSQPAVTRSIHRLEESLGCKLFTRVSRGVRLTVEGTALFSHVDSAFKSLSNGERELKRLAAFEAGTPIIGAAETPLYHFLLPKLGQFREMHPNVTLQVQGSSTHETIQMLRAEQADVVLAVSPLTDVEDLSVTELASFRDVFVAGPRFKSLAIGILPSLFAQSLLAQEGFFALDTEPIPARQILLVHRGEGRTSLLCILTSSKRKKPCHIKALQMRRTPFFGKNVRKTEFISLPQPHHTLHQQTDGGDARPAAGSQQQRFSPALYQLDHVAVQSDSRHSHDDEELAQLLQRLKHR